MSSRKKGFTLVELLIVIVVIGVLSAMMMLSSTEAVSSAKATNIINNLRNWKTATLEWYTDHIDEVEKTANDGNGIVQRFANNVHAEDIAPYVSSNFKNVEKLKAWDSSNGYYFTDHINGGDTNTLTNKPTNGIWLIGYDFSETGDAKNESLKKKLEARASTAGLLWKNGKNIGQYRADHDTDKGGSALGTAVWIMVMDFSK